jgi:hypothetical protein
VEYRAVFLAGARSNQELRNGLPCRIELRWVRCAVGAEGVLYGAKRLHVEGQAIVLGDNRHGAPGPKRVADAQFVEDIGIGEREIGYRVGDRMRRSNMAL